MADPTSIASTVAATAVTKVVGWSIDKAMVQAGYLFHYKSYVNKFDDGRTKLSETKESVQQRIEESRNENMTRVDPHVQGWLKRTDALVTENKDEGKEKRILRFLPNCIWRIQRAKDLEEKANTIEKLIGESNQFPVIARATELVGVECLSLPEFMQFESRKTRFEELKEALKDENNFVIGLHGMGGTGKTTMAVEAGNEVLQAEVFHKVIFTVVSNSNRPADVTMIRGDIARHLGLTLEGNESGQRDQLLTRIAKGRQKTLIILDDVWDKLSLYAIGIPPGRHDQGACCTVLLTTRSLGLCREMGCQKAIGLETLSTNDALNLFLSHSGKKGDDSSQTDFKDVALHIVNECGRLPVAIVPIAITLNSQPLEYWEAALTRLQNFNPLSHDLNEDLVAAFKSLSLSFDHLDEKAQELLLVCSLFPEDFEIPTELLRRIAIGLGLGGEADTYNVARSRVLDIERKLLDSSLLSNAHREQHVKLHDLVHEVVLKQANTKIQAIMSSETTLKENIRYSSWSLDFIPIHFCSSKLEFLVVWIDLPDYETTESGVPDTLFEGMTKLKVLLLFATFKGRSLDIPLDVPLPVHSFKSLTSIQTLTLSHWSLGDISVMRNLQCLESLQLNYCKILEFPNEVSELKKLRLLGLSNCEIRRNDPLKVIERCKKLEELYLDNNVFEVDAKNKVELLHNGTRPTLQRYHIIGDSPYSSLTRKVTRSFKPMNLQESFSEATFKFLVARAQSLELRELGETGWTNLIPDIISMEDGGMKDLIKLSLHDCFNIECLIHTKDLQHSVTIFPKLVKLRLRTVNVKEFCCGPLPIDFLKQLETLDLWICPKLEGTLFKSKIELSKLKFVRLWGCSIMTYVFDISVVQSLKHLETLDLDECDELKYIVVDEGSEKEKVDDDDLDPNQKNHGSMLLDRRGFLEKGTEIKFPSLKSLSISRLPSFISILPKFYHRGASVIDNSSPPATRDGSSAKYPSSSPTFSWASICCFQPKSCSVSIDNPTVPKQSTSQALKTEKVLKTVQCLLRPPLNPLYMREMYITQCPQLESLFTLTIASSMLVLEKLEVRECKRLKHIVIVDGDGHDHVNYSIFPNMREVRVRDCNLLEFLFPASHFRTPDHLTSLEILSCQNLRHVFGRCFYEDNCLPPHNQMIEIHLTALKSLNLQDVPNMVSIFIENCHITTISPLEDVTLSNCPQLDIGPFTGSSIGGNERQEYLKLTKVMNMQREKLIKLYLSKVKIDTIFDLQEEMKSNLKWVILIDLELKHICVGTRNVLNLENLSILAIQGSKKLQVIFSASVLRSLPHLQELDVSECEELVQIVEETERNPDLLRNKCFPALNEIKVKGCNKLRCLFSISICGMLPNLEILSIEDNPEMVQVFECEETKELILKDVFPLLVCQEFKNLPSFVSFCQGFESQMILPYDMFDCPNFSLTSSTATDIQDEDSEVPSLEVSVSSDNPSPETNSHSQGNAEAQAALSERKLSSQIQDMVETSDQDGPKLNKSMIPDGIPSQNEFPQNIEVGIPEGHSSEKDNKITLSTHSVLEITRPSSSSSTKGLDVKKSVDDGEEFREGIRISEAIGRVDKSLNNGEKDKVPTNISSLSSYGETQSNIAISDLESEASKSNQAGVPGKTESPQGQIIVNQTEINIDEEIKADHISPEELEEDYIIKLFQMMEEGADIEVGMPYVSKIFAVKDDNTADLEASSKMGLNEIACSEENILSLQNALNLLSTYCSKDEASSHGISSTIDSLQQEIQSTLSSFKQASSTIHTFSELEEKVKSINEEVPRRKKAAKTLIYEIYNTETSVVKAKQKGVELKEKISRMQAELNSTEEEIKDYETKLASLQDQKKKCASETIGFMKEFESVKKDKSQMVEEQIKARQELGKVDGKWSSCVANLRKTTLLLGLHLNHKL